MGGVEVRERDRYRSWPERVPVQVYGGGREIGMRFDSVPTVQTTLSVMAML
jgi:hypothetical protein